MLSYDLAKISGKRDGLTKKYAVTELGETILNTFYK
jgi:hypothetical protein